MTLQPTLVILAAAGPRPGRPALLDPVGPADEPLLSYSIRDGLRAGCHAVCIVSPEGESDRFRKILLPYTTRPDEFWICEQRVGEGRTRPWGTAQAVMAAVECGIPTERGIVVLNGDDFYGRTAIKAAHYAALCAAPDDALTDGGLVSYPLDRTLKYTDGVARARCQIEDGLLVGLEEWLDVHRRGGSLFGCPADPSGQIEPDRSDLTAYRSMEPRQPVSMNLWALGPRALESLAQRWASFQKQSTDSGDELRLPVAIQSAIESFGLRIGVTATEETPFGLTHSEDLPAVKRELARLVREGEYPQDLRVRQKAS